MSDRQIDNEMMYEMIFKRKSFHLFPKHGRIPTAEIKRLQAVFNELTPLESGIKYAIRLLPESDTTCKRNAEYCILLYSEKKGNYLRNIGYIGEQLDLYLASRNVGSLWFGIGNIKDKSFDGLSFVIMLAIAAMDSGDFREDMNKSKRKSLPEVWCCNGLDSIGDTVRFAPSACNLQPWRVEGGAERLTVIRYRHPTKRGIIPVKKINFYNRIDIGIFLLFTDVCLRHEGVKFERMLLDDLGEDETENTPVAEYLIESEKASIKML